MTEQPNSLLLRLKRVFYEAVSQSESELKSLLTAPEDFFIARATRVEFGHYQCNQAMPWAKQAGRAPREIAAELVELVRASIDSALCPQMEIAGPGFINITLPAAFLLDEFSAVRAPRHGLQPVSEDRPVIIDYSSPNIAKEMHVGHLRSTIIGESVARILEYCGYNVERVNHLGDWGTQFGMLICYLKEEKGYPDNTGFEITDLVAFYREAKKRFDEDTEFADRSRKEVTLLQSGDSDNLKAWQMLCDVSRSSFDEIYNLLQVDLIERGESFYNPMLPAVVDNMDDRGLLKMSDGAACVFIEEIKNREGEPLPLILRKSDGGYTYDTTDMAALHYRLYDQSAGRVIYVTDKGQSTHFKQVFIAAQNAGWLDEKPARLDHVGFGLVLGEDRKKFRTRSGETVRLKDLLTEAIERARKIVLEKNPDFSAEQAEEVARVIGLGAVKYADLSQNRESDYVFSYDRMLQLQGNTAPYLIYVYVRIMSIFRKSGEVAEAELLPEHESETDLLFHLLRFRETVAVLLDDFATQHLAEYLYELCQLFNRFYHDCPVLQAEEKVRASRLNLISKTADTLKDGLYLLGIDVVDQM